MKYRTLGRTGWKVSEISFGAWAIGGTWGPVEDKESLAALHAALDGGVNFFDTADVYGDGHSERLLARLKKERKENFYIATKAGRRLNPHTAEGYNRKNLTAFIERSLKNLDTDAIDLLQLHCPPPAVFYQPEVFGILDDLVKAGKLRHYGVSVEKVEEALKAIEFPNVQTIQIIFNIFRQRPAELFFAEAQTPPGRHPRAGAAGVRNVVRQNHAREPVCEGRPPEFQPSRRGVRPRRNFFRRGFREPHTLYAFFRREPDRAGSASAKGNRRDLRRVNPGDW